MLAYNSPLFPATPLTMLPIVDRYILGEITKTFLGIVIIMLLILIGSGYLRFLGAAAAGTIGSEAMIRLVAVEALRLLGPILPPSLFLAILFTLGRMYRDSEMVALAAGGVGPARLFRVVLLTALPVFLLVSWLTLEIQPWANGMKRSIFRQQESSVDLGSGIVGRFNEFNRGDLVFYVEGVSADGERLRNIFVQNRKHGRLGLTVSAEGYREVDPETGERFIVLTDGRRYEGLPGDNRYTMGQFGRYRLRVEAPRVETGRQPIDAQTTASLLRSDRLSDRVELQYRLMLPLAVLVFALIGVPLSYSLPRSGFYGKVVLAILFYLVFMNLLAASGNWMESGTTPAWMGRWWVHLLMLLLASLVLLIRSPELIAWWLGYFRRRRPR